MREAGVKAPDELVSFLEKHAAPMPGTMLRYAIEYFDKKQQLYYLGLKNLNNK